MHLYSFPPDQPDIYILDYTSSPESNLFVKKVVTPGREANITREYGLLPGTSAIVECVTVDNRPDQLEIEWRSYVDSLNKRSVLLEKATNESSLRLNITQEGTYLCLAKLRFSKCQTGISIATLEIRVNELNIRKSVIVIRLAPHLP